jgi:acylphosphatase
VTIVRHIIIHGRVQGVGYRAWTEHAALAHGLTGWVRNRRDGAVEAVISGPPEAVAAMVEACRNGPGGARVDAIDARDGAVADLAMLRPGERFSVLPTV